MAYTSTLRLQLTLKASAVRAPKPKTAPAAARLAAEVRTGWVSPPRPTAGALSPPPRAPRCCRGHAAHPGAGGRDAVRLPSACYRLLPATRSLSTATITVFGNSVATLTGSLKRRAFVVGNRAHAEHMRAVFDLMWTEVARVPDGQRTPEIVRRVG